MKIKRIVSITGSMLLTGLLPAFAFAQAQVSTSAGISGILTAFNSTFFNEIVTLLIALGIIYFLWGVLKYVNAGGEEKAAKEGRQMIINGLIALFVMVSVDGLVKILLSTFGFSYTIPKPPTN